MMMMIIIIIIIRLHGGGGGAWEGEQTCLDFKSNEDNGSKLKRIANRLGGRGTD